MPRVSKTVQTRRERVEKILPLLKAEHPDARCSLNYTNPLELVVATILSAQCTDERVNRTTPELFKTFPDAAAYADASPEDIEPFIQSCGFFRQKANSIHAMGTSLVEQYDGEVPRTMEQLTKLRGVGRKTANVVLGNAFDINVGVTVDTHVTRLSNRLKLTKHESDAVRIEKDLMEVVPQEEWTDWSHLLIHHGRRVCVARSPRCENCTIFEHCPTGPTVIAEREMKQTKRRR